jgi:hypothetical protein
MAFYRVARKMQSSVRPASAVPANSRWFSKAKIPYLFFAKKSFATFSAAMHSDAQTLLLTLAYLPRTMRSPVLMKCSKRTVEASKNSPTPLELLTLEPCAQAMLA